MGDGNVLASFNYERYNKGENTVFHSPFSENQRTVLSILGYILRQFVASFFDYEVDYERDDLDNQAH